MPFAVEIIAVGKSKEDIQEQKRTSRELKQIKSITKERINVQFQKLKIKNLLAFIKSCLNGFPLPGPYAGVTCNNYLNLRFIKLRQKKSCHKHDNY